MLNENFDRHPPRFVSAMYVLLFNSHVNSEMGRVFYERVGIEFVPIDSMDICGPYDRDGFNFGRVLEQLVFLLIITIITVSGIYLKQFMSTFTCVWRRRNSTPIQAAPKMHGAAPLLSAEGRKLDHSDSVDCRVDRVISRQSVSSHDGHYPNLS